jgi:hypothetical protein
MLDKINEDAIEAILEKVFEMSSELKNLQEGLQDIDKSLKDVNANYISGKISQEMYKGSRNDLAKRRKIAIDKINKTVNGILAVSKSLPAIISKSKV